MTILIIQKTAAIGEIILSSPENFNLIEEDTFARISQALDNFEHDDEVRVVFIGAKCGTSGKTNQKIFSAGVNLKKYNKSINSDEFRQKLRKNRELPEKIEKFTKPVVIGIDGLVIGGFFELALACDVILASSEAAFCLNEVNVGLIPGYGGINRLIKRVGRTRAFEIIATGRRITPEGALVLGIITKILPATEFYNYCNNLAAKPAASLKQIKNVINGADEVEAFIKAASSQEAKMLLLKYL